MITFSQDHFIFSSTHWCPYLFGLTGDKEMTIRSCVRHTIEGEEQQVPCFFLFWFCELLVITKGFGVTRPLGFFCCIFPGFLSESKLSIVLCRMNLVLLSIDKYTYSCCVRLVWLWLKTTRVPKSTPVLHKEKYKNKQKKHVFF